jgi:hypothetical protein
MTAPELLVLGVQVTILAFSGERERERSDRRGRPPATPGWAATGFLSAILARGVEDRGSQFGAHGPRGARVGLQTDSVLGRDRSDDLLKPL